MERSDIKRLKALQRENIRLPELLSETMLRSGFAEAADAARRN